METKTIQLTYGFPGRVTEYEIIHNALDYITAEIQQRAWTNRPQYDEDAGTFVDMNTYNPLDYFNQFVCLDFAAKISERMNATNEEADFLHHNNKEDGCISDVTIEREFVFLELAAIVQAIFYYLDNIEKDYKKKATDLYDSDNHYTGNPLQHFLDAATEQAREDTKKYRKLAMKLGKISRS